MNLYELTEQMRFIETTMEQWAIEHDGDITDFPLAEELEQLEGEKHTKFLNIGCWIKNLLGKAAMVEAEEKRLRERRTALKNKAERLKSYLAEFVPVGEKYSDGRASLSWRKTESVDISIAPEALPDVYQRVKVEADKTGIKKVLKTGAVIDGCKLVTKQNIIIK